MLSRSRFVVCSAILFTTACSTPSSRTAAAPESAGDAVAATSADSSQPVPLAVSDPLVCKRVVQTGTRVAQRICQRQSQIDAKKQAAQDLLKEVQQRGAQGNDSAP